jgi:hypothetical protein
MRISFLTFGLACLLACLSSEAASAGKGKGKGRTKIDFRLKTDHCCPVNFFCVATTLWGAFI